MKKFIQLIILVILIPGFQTCKKASEPLKAPADFSYQWSQDGEHLNVSWSHMEGCIGYRIYIQGDEALHDFIRIDVTDDNPPGSMISFSIPRNALSQAFFISAIGLSEKKSEGPGLEISSEITSEVSPIPLDNIIIPQVTQNSENDILEEPGGSKGGISENKNIIAMGWSKDGKFAFKTNKYWTNSVPTSGYTVSYRIFDAITDSILYRKDDVLEYEGMDGETHYEGDPFVISWDRMKDEIMAEFSRLGIVPDVRLLETFPLEFESKVGKYYAADIKNIEEKESAEYPGYFEMTYDLWIYCYPDATMDSGTKKGKKVTSGAYGGQWLPYSNTIDGYSKSPFESRIAIIYTFSGRGFESEPFEYVEITGCHLTANFADLPLAGK